MASKILAITSLWRDSELYIDKALGQFENLEATLAEKNISCVYSFFENDSADDTAERLLRWLRKRKGILLTETINAPKWGSVSSLERVRYQARYRNIGLYPLNEYYNYDYLLVADSDVDWEPELVLGMMERLDANETWGMISPNTVQNVRDYVEDTDRPSYFDSWSLKDKQNRQCLTFAANPFLDKEDRDNWENKKPVSCNSAFGSIAMVKAEAMDDVEWDVIDGVEHWEFCAGIRKNGYEVIADPSLEAKIIHKKEVVPHPHVLDNQRKYLSMHQVSSVICMS